MLGCKGVAKCRRVILVVPFQSIGADGHNGGSHTRRTSSHNREQGVPRGVQRTDGVPLSALGPRSARRRSNCSRRCVGRDKGSAMARASSGRVSVVFIVECLYRIARGVAQGYSF